MTQASASGPLGLSFREHMRGQVSLHKSAIESAGQDSRFDLFGVLEIDDLAAFLGHSPHRARLSGSIHCPAISADDLAIRDGTFELFRHDPTNVNTRTLNYQATFGDGYEMVGRKVVRNDAYGFDLWPDTTALFVDVFRKNKMQPEKVGHGVLHLSPIAFLRELASLKVSNAPSPGARLNAAKQFALFFCGQLLEAYGGVLTAARTLFDPQAPTRSRRPLSAGSPDIHWARTNSGINLRLSHYQGGDKGPVMLVHGLGVSSLIFSQDTIETNLVEYLCERGFDVWLLDYRASIDLPYGTLPYTADNVAREDFPAAVDRICSLTGAPSVQTIVHCFGATTFFMAMLAGLSNVRSAVVSQIACHVEVPLATKLKALFHAPDLLAELGVKSLTAYVDTDASLRERLVDFVLKLYPVSGGPRDSDAVSRRIAFLYGQLYEIDQLNEETYSSLHEMFGVASITSLQHLAMIVSRKQIVDFQGNDVYLRQSEGYPTIGSLAIPMLFLHGEKNQCWLPASTERTVNLLRSRNRPDLYDRKVIQDYGHIDCIFGKNAARDVFPAIAEHLLKTAHVR